jgi:hypothetical protein
MTSLYFWPESPGWSLLVLFALSQVLFYAARVPVHRALRKVGAALGGALRIAARWLRSASDELHRRNREVLLEAGRTEAEAKLEREFTRLATTFTTELKEYPALHKRLDESVRKVEEDLKASALTPPEAPGWPEAVQAMAALPKAGDRTVQKVLDEIHRSAVASEKKALAEYRDATARRHKVLAQIAPVWKAIKGLLEQVQRAVTGTLASAGRIDGYMERYEKIRRGEDAVERGLAAGSLNLFIISAFVVAVAGFGGLVNFQLIARPMSELVAGGGYVFGLPISKIAALVIVLMEVAAGIFVMETLGITHLFPKLSGLPASRRRVIFGVALIGLLLLALIEASLAILREQLLEADKAMSLSLSIAGEAAATRAPVEAPLLSRIPMIGQAVLGFILPWILAMIAVPLEMLVESGRHVVGRGLGLLLRGLGALLRICAHLVRYLAAALAHVFDIYIVIPLQVERLVRGSRGQVLSPVESAALKNPTERTQPFRAPRP